ncbi:hypothetical protein PAXRUDRAFT_141203, partial [Paxillus rubicundulus Ve08.2h10]
IIAHLQHAVPQIFAQKAKDGSMFQCLDSWVQKILYENLQFTMYKATQAAHKLLSNASEVCLEQFLCLTLTIWDDVIISASFHVNINQTNIIYQPANNHTYRSLAQNRSQWWVKKSACTLVCGVSNGGELLPFQIILQGKYKHSIPSPKSPGHEAAKLGFKFVVSNTDMYWSACEIMCSYVSDILVPFWNEKENVLMLLQISLAFSSSISGLFTALFHFEHA